MLYFFNSESYHDSLKEAGINFLHGIYRAYIFVSNLVYKGERIDLAIPFHANISTITQKEGLFLEFKSTDHTKTGKKAGLNLAMAIPFSRKLFNGETKFGKNLKYGVKIANLNMAFIRKACQEMLNNYEKGIIPTHGIKNFDKTIEIKNKCVTSIKSHIQKSTQENKPTQSPKLDKPNDNKHTVDYLRDFNKVSSKTEKDEIAKKFKEANPNFVESINNNLKSNSIGSNVGSKSINPKETLNNNDDTKK